MSYDNYNHSFRRSILAEPTRLVAAENLFTPTIDQKYMLGAIFTADDGRKWRYCKDDGTGIVAHAMVASFIPDPQGLNVAQTAQAVSAGEKRFDSLITTANALSDGDLVDGYLFVNEGATGGTGGDMYVIKNNRWTTEDTVINIEIADQGGIRIGINAADNLNFIKNKCRDVHITPTSTLTSPALGVTMAAVTASYYFWAQFKGYATCALDDSDTIAVGAPVGYPGTAGTAGSVGTIADDGTDMTWGSAVTVTAAHVLVDLDMP